ncbi:unnamed protein product [Adineta ricciae]|uniref:Uncharacterized protein n=1 Tax=Adineta ricciae TaxID=249248 RepID=A0A815I973_ADIRI|nr:unnamed protein product [Adineta ricciae]
MSENELIRKYYHDSYKTNSHGFIVCPLYNEKKNEDDQICKFLVENDGDSLTPEQFEYLWSHVKSRHEDTYRDILKMCRSKIVDVSKTNQYDNLMDTIAFPGRSFRRLDPLKSESVPAENPGNPCFGPDEIRSDPRPSESNAIPSPGFHRIRRIPVGSDKILYWIR